eukprot:1875400-Prymnesium_polylepis.1
MPSSAFARTCLTELLNSSLINSCTSDGRHLAVPFVDIAVGTDTEDGRVRSVDEERQVVCDPLHLSLAALQLSDVLTHTDHAEQLARRVPARGGVQQHLDTLATLGDERELEVVCLHTLQRLGKHGVHGNLVLVDDEVANE